MPLDIESNPGEAHAPRCPLPLAPTPRHDTAAKFRVLFVSSAPPSAPQIAVEHERRTIRTSLRRARWRDSIELECRAAVSFRSLSRALLDNAFDLVHFAGHGVLEGLMLEDDRHHEMLIAAADIAELLTEHAQPRGRIRCVIINACLSALIGVSVSRTIPTTIFMRGYVGDRAAILFSEGFYDALGAGKTIGAAFREGRRRARVLGHGDPFEPILLTNRCSLLTSPPEVK